jgi:uncharacterized protein (DUF885 family)
VKLSAVALVLATVLLSCTPSQTEDQKFEALARNYIERLLEMNPVWATALGEHRYDAQLGDYSVAGIQANRRINAVYLDSLGRIQERRLSPENTIDYNIMKTNLAAWIFQTDTLKEFEWNPLNYNIGDAIYGLTSRDFAPLKERLISVKERLRGVPKALAAAKANLKNPPKIYTETAISQNPGTISLVRDEINGLLAQAPELKPEIAPIQAEAVAALEDYGAWLKKDLLPRSSGDFRIGDEKFRRKLYYTLESSLSKEQILQRAEADLKRTQQDMYETSLGLFRKLFPNAPNTAGLNDKKFVIKSVLDRLADAHPSNETIVDTATAVLQRATDFVRRNNLVTVPHEPVKVIVMPEYQRGVAVAYCNAPGPLEKNGETFFSISPTPKDWTKQRVASFFREYNNYMLEDLTIHEAMPGHYLQLAHANRFKAPTMIRAIFGSGTFVEGWATYAEQLMAEKGFDGPEVLMQQLKMRLRLIINAIIDQKIHTAGMMEKEAMDLMMNEGFQEEGEAAGKWRRACLSSTQLSTYYIGNTEINDIRKAYEAKHGSNSDMKTLHDLMLSFGSPAPKYVMQAMGL